MGGPVKYRHEYKYICNAMQNAVLKTRAKALMTGDFHAGADGSYRIRMRAGSGRGTSIGSASTMETAAGSRLKRRARTEG